MTNLVVCLVRTQFVYKVTSRSKLQTQFAHIAYPDETLRNAHAALLILLFATLIAAPSPAGLLAGQFEKCLDDT